MSQGSQVSTQDFGLMFIPTMTSGVGQDESGCHGSRELPPTGSLQESVHSPGYYAVAWPTSSGINCAALGRCGCLSDCRSLGEEAHECALKCGGHRKMHQVGAVDSSALATHSYLNTEASSTWGVRVQIQKENILVMHTLLVGIPKARGIRTLQPTLLAMKLERLPLGRKPPLYKDLKLMFQP